MNILARRQTCCFYLLVQFCMHVSYIAGHDGVDDEVDAELENAESVKNCDHCGAHWNDGFQ